LSSRKCFRRFPSNCLNPPSNTLSSYIPWTEEKGDITACGIPINYNASKEWADKKVILFALPGAFTPVCSARHVPEYIERLPEIRAKGVDVVAVLAYNDAYVMSAWGKANQVTNDDILFLSDPDAKFSKSIGWADEEGRTGRYAIIIDHGKVTYAAREPAKNHLEVCHCLVSIINSFPTILTIPSSRAPTLSSSTCKCSTTTYPIDDLIRVNKRRGGSGGGVNEIEN
jgi:alkyl hydroperoxide reductase 1